MYALVDEENMDWVSPAYSRTKVDAAGHILSSEAADLIGDDEWNEALAIINNWRSSHSRPLYTLRFCLRRNAEKVNRTSLVAQRIKRLSSIRLKLELSPHMKLSQMQDIGGCRAVVDSVREVEQVASRIKNSEIKHKLISEDNYIATPRRSGYRSSHLIYKFFSDKKATHNGLRIELQIRSQLQHAWATAVEIAGTFVQQALKSSQGEEDWLRFFALMGSAIAIREGSPLVPDTPLNEADLKHELREYATRLDVTSRLHAYGEAVQIVDNAAKNADYYLLELDSVAMRVNVVGFKQSELGRAANEYLATEKAIAKNPGSDAVLVSADSMDSLRRAYPNYFLDTHRFVEAVIKALE